MITGATFEQDGSRYREEEAGGQGHQAREKKLTKEGAKDGYKKAKEEHDGGKKTHMFIARQEKKITK